MGRSTIRKAPTLRVGDWVTIPFGVEQARAKIIEDRGTLGVGGRRLYRVRMYHSAGVATAPPVTIECEVPEEEVTAAHLDPGEVLDYLSQGGLIEILKKNQTGGKNPPRVWLRIDEHGKISYTFTPGGGLAGGEAIPFRANVGEKIVRREQDAVVDFLKSFGLDTKQAEDVVKSVGVS